MLEEAIKVVLQKVIKEKYPHINSPFSSYAKITSMKESSNYYIYSIKILDKNNLIDEEFPEIPDIYSKIKFEKGTKVAVIFIYDQDLFIVGEVV